jgi:hypothetical protein
MITINNLRLFELAGRYCANNAIFYAQSARKERSMSQQERFCQACGMPMSAEGGEKRKRRVLRLVLR